MYKEILEKILEASRNHSLTFFVGSGVSALSNAPTWKALIDGICKELGKEIKPKYTSDEYIQIPQMYYYSIEKDNTKYFDFVRSKVLSNGLVPNQIHREMLDLTPISFITTNYDTLIEDAAMQKYQNLVVVSQDSDIPSINGERFVLKMHGDFSHNNIVLKEEDYLSYSENFKLVETLAKSIFSTNTVVFIGYSLSDYNIKLILNWTKSLLKGNFHKPIFVCTGEKLSKEEKVYHESKGLSVIECCRLKPKSNDFYDQYQAFFDAIKALTKYSLNNKAEDEAFVYLYELLKPLDDLKALRKSDIAHKLEDYASIAPWGIITIKKEYALLAKKFIEINNHSNKELKYVKKHYKTILSVLKKARIDRVEIYDGESTPIEYSGEFANCLCINFDYEAMTMYVSKQYGTVSSNYTKAYYLLKLARYDEALYLFAEVASEAFQSKDYLLYYLAKTNCIRIEKIIDNINKYRDYYDIDETEYVSPSAYEVERLFMSLPSKFQSDYASLKDLYSPNMIYQYSYHSFMDGQKLLHSIETNTIEFGATSSGRVVIRINDYLHFLFGNGIVADEFQEYHETIKNLMTALLYKYVSQDKEKLHQVPFEDFGESKVHFDEVDFFCFVNYFNHKEITSLFKKYEINNLCFDNIQIVEKNIRNLMDYYEYLLSNNSSRIEIEVIENKLCTCMSLVPYLELSTPMVERICYFLMVNEFEYILIDDKIKVLHSQLVKRKKENEAMRAVVGDALIAYIDQHLEAAKNNRQFNVRTHSSDVNYPSLVYLLDNDQNKNLSVELSKRVGIMINANIENQISNISRHYWRYINSYQKRKFIKWVKQLALHEFSFEYVNTLVLCKADLEPEIVALLKEYLHNSIKQKPRLLGRVYPVSEPYVELNQVGYWCLINALDSRDFKEFLGYSNEFDLYCLYGKVDASEYNVAKLLKLYPHALEILASNSRVKKQIRKSIILKLTESQIVESDKQKLQDILIKYFC